MQKKVWFITGSSTGFGKCLCEELLAQDELVVMTARNIENLKNLNLKYPQNSVIVKCDVTNNSDIKDAVALAIKHFGRIDVLVNNAGYGIVGAIEEVSEEELLRVFNTNVFGLINLTKEVLPHMRERKAGHIYNLSSIAGLVSTPGFGIYNATKYAVEGMSEALAGEVKTFGIKVTIVEPGPFKTDFANRSLAVMPEMKAYDQAMLQTRDYIKKVDGNQPGDPIKAAKLMFKVSRVDNPPLRLLLGKIAYDRFAMKMDLLKKDFEEWKEDNLGTDF